MAVRGGKLPARRTGTRVRERRHVRIVQMRFPPDLQIEGRKKRRFTDREAEHAEVRNRGEPAAPVKRVRRERVVIAGQDHDRRVELSYGPRGALEQGGWQAVVLEGIAR